MHLCRVSPLTAWLQRLVRFLLKHKINQYSTVLKKRSGELSPALRAGGNGKKSSPMYLVDEFFFGRNTLFPSAPRNSSLVGRQTRESTSFCGSWRPGNAITAHAVLWRRRDISAVRRRPLCLGRDGARLIRVKSLFNDRGTRFRSEFLF